MQQVQIFYSKFETHHHGQQYARSRCAVTSSNSEGISLFIYFKPEGHKKDRHKESKLEKMNCEFQSK